MRRAVILASFLFSLLFEVGSSSADWPAYDSGIDQFPDPISRAEPEYPGIAREARVEGTVFVQALVDTSGRVVSVRVIKSIPMLDRAALECVRQWRFKPAQSRGRLMSVWVGIPIRFQLSDADRSLSRAPVGWLRDGLTSGRYHINGDTTKVVLFTRVDSTHVRVESPGEWEGSGNLVGRMYWGVFSFRADASAPEMRGARGTHLGSIEGLGRLEVSSAYANRLWPDFVSTWRRFETPPGNSTR